MAHKEPSVDELVAVMEREKVLELSEDDLQTVMGHGGNDIIARVCVPAKYPKRDEFIKVLKRLWGSDSITYTEIGFNAMVGRFVSAEARDISCSGPWLCDGVPLSHIRINRFRVWAFIQPSTGMFL